MKNPRRFTVFYSLLAVLLSISAVMPSFAQTPNEKLIATIPPASYSTEAYSIKYSPTTGAWVYGSYDTTSRMYTLITSKGSSKPCSFVMQYNTLFDYDGNSYTIAGDYVNDTSSSYYILKNNEPSSASYTFINDGWGEKNGVIYFSAQKDGRYYFCSYDMKSAQVTESRPYEEIRLVYVPQAYTEGEPMGYVGFTKDGRPYYVAVADNEAFMVIGGVEQKHYSDISYYDVKMDNNDVPVYVARDIGKMYEERGNTFIVHGTNEYRKFDWIYGPILMDNNNVPVYIGQDSIGEYMYRSTIMRGGTETKTYDGSVYSYMFAPNGKLGYIVASNTSGDAGYSMVVFDGKDGKKYNSVGFLKFTKSSQPVYTITDKNGKSQLIDNGSTVAGKYDYFPDFGYLEDGTLYYIGTNYGNYEQKKPDKNFVVIDGEKQGPYDFTYTSDYTTGTIIVSDKKGNYAYVAGKNTDFDNYYYKYNVITNNWRSDDFDVVTDTKLINGKVTYFAGNMKVKGEYNYDYRLYVNNKPVGGTFSSISEVKDNGSGTLSFLGSRGDNVYYVEVKP